MTRRVTVAARPLRTDRRTITALAACLVAWSIPLAAQTVVSPAQVLDDFAAPAAWQAVGSDDVQASVHPAAGPTGPALRLDFDLGGTAGYASARRALPLDLPPNYEITFFLRADAPVNELQVKLIDASGDNVWWFRQPDFEFPREWQLVKIKKRQIEFAWGPSGDHALRRAATIEFVVNAGRGGGSGSVFVSGLALRELPPDSGVLPAPTAEASSSLPGAEPARALDGDPATAWESDPAAGKTQSLTIDLGRVREFGGVVLRWRPDAFASHYDVLFSGDGERWQTVHRVVDGRGGPDALRFPEAEARFIRLALRDGPGDHYGLADVEIKDLAFGATPNAFVAALARAAPRGTYPRGFSDEQSYWTLVGIDGGHETGLLSEDGALEVARGGFSIEPFLIAGRVVTWADVKTQPFLVGGNLPLPGVRWLDPRWELRITAFASGNRARSRLVAGYELINRTAHRLTVTLALAVRPFQVNPPTQFLSTVGGVSPISSLAWDGAAFSVEGVRRVFPLRPPDHVGAFSSAAGPIPRILAGEWRDAPSVHDEAGLASAVLAYQLQLAPHARARMGMVIPLSGPAAAPEFRGQRTFRWLEREQRTVAAAWKQKLQRIRFRVPATAQPLIDTLRAALAQLLITRDGPIVRPGTRAYARSWIRDGAMISEALMRLGHETIAADYLRWYAPYQFQNGKIPCCVDRRGGDPVPENDSPGEFLFLVGEVYRYQRDRALLEAMWPHVERAAHYLEALRQAERIPANLEPARRAFFGMLPASISHEGYAAKPVHSYWDNFWALKGYDAAQAIALALDREQAASRFLAQGEEFRRELAASLQAATAAHRIDYLPGSAELGDFDPTSTSIAFAPHGNSQDLPGALARSTYERYWREFQERRDGQRDWDDYTPYELRNVATFVRLGWRDRAAESFPFFLAGQRPGAWRQWAEVVGRDARQPRFVGDMPHAWVASDYIGSVLDLFAYERDADHALVLGAGLPPVWLHGRGIAVAGLCTPYGPLSYTLRMQDSRTVLRVAAGTRVPPGGFVFPWPAAPLPRLARVNGRRADWHNGELRIAELPATVVVDR